MASNPNKPKLVPKKDAKQADIVLKDIFAQMDNDEDVKPYM
jgi:hypothetical protein